ncbi:hypothetical protein L828_3204 [Mycobacteroides abscessus MAB_030201_1061]|nr:hypothetical protein L828_3204 [Mycobacteroides abscessus MAB_030201_1061]
MGYVVSQRLSLVARLTEWLVIEHTNSHAETVVVPIAV